MGKIFVKGEKRMLYLKKGCVYTASFSFALPEDLCIVSDPITVSPDTMMFETVDGKYQILIGAYESDKSPLSEIEHLLSLGGHKSTTEKLDIERGGMRGKGIFYRSNSWSHEYYEERLEFPMNEEGQNAFELVIQHEITDESERNQVQKFLTQANIEEFLRNISYNPEAYKRYIQ